MATTSETGLEPPRSVTPGDASDLTGVSPAAGSQKRGRGRPPKPKSGSQPNGAVQARKPSGRPKRNRDPAAAVPAVVRRGRGRPKRSNTLSPTESLVERSRKRGRPKKDDVAGAPAKKRGRKPKSEQVAKRSVGRPKKATEGSTGQGAADSREVKKKAALLQKKVKQAAEKLKVALSAIEEVQELAAGM